MANVVLLRAYLERPNFYSAAVYISQSTGSLMFLVNLMLIVAASIGYGLQRLFYGTLRPIETEQLYDKAWFAVSETLLAMTIFRDDIGIWFFTMFLCLLAGKVWQWIGEGRVEFLEQQPPANPKLFHARLMSSLLLSVTFDVFMMQYCIDSILSDARPGVMVMFGFEYVLLAIASISTLMRYALSLVELFITYRQEKAREEARHAARVQAQLRAEETGIEETATEDDEDEEDVPGWEEKGRWVFYLDLATDFIKTVVYLGFFMILMTFYGIPIHIMRDLFMTIRSLIKRINDFIQYRNATRDMNTRYPDATPEELERENTCIVCREEMRPWTHQGGDTAHPPRRLDERQRPKKLPCGHILHFSCLRSWLERQQVCPTCRRPVLAQTTHSTVQGNNAVNQAPVNQRNQGNQGALHGFLRRDQADRIAQQGQQNIPMVQAQGQPPAGNLRVFNFGPFRIALGNLRLPQGQQNGPNNIRDAVDQLHQRAVQGDQGGETAPVLNQNTAQFPTQPSPVLSDPIPGAVALHPHDVQSDILGIQRNIIESMRQLSLQHEQLEVLHRLLGELNHIQQTSGIAAASGQELPHIASLHPPNMDEFHPQAYFARGSVLRQGDAGVPEGLTLPEGWTLRPMAQSQAQVQTPLGSGVSGRSSRLPGHPSDAAEISGLYSRPSALPRQGQEERPHSRSGPSGPVSTGGPGWRPTEPSSLESSWSFGNVGERNEGESTSSAVARRSSEGTVTRRAVTVEDAEDNGR